MTKLFKFGLIGLAVSAAGTWGGAAQASSAEIRKEIDDNAESWLASYDVPSVAVAYVENGAVAWSAVYGEQAPGVPATDKTLYNVASMTKPITAEIVLRLASTGEFSLVDPMSDHWIDPDIKDDPRHRLLTPRIALSHRTGFANWRRQNDDNVLRFQWDPDTRAGYSGEGYEYVARFVEKKTGRTLEALAQRHVFGPIGMTDTSYTERDWFAGRAATPQGPGGERRAPDIRATWKASDDLHTTPADYAAFLASVMNDEGVTDEIAAARFASIENQFPDGCPWGPDECPASVGFGLGWAVFAYETETVIMQGGGDWGERTLGFFVPERNIGVVIFTNGANGSKVVAEAVKRLYPDNAAFHAFLDFQAR